MKGFITLTESHSTDHSLDYTMLVNVGSISHIECLSSITFRVAVHMNNGDVIRPIEKYGDVIKMLEEATAERFFINNDGVVNL